MVLRCSLAGVHIVATVITVATAVAVLFLTTRHRRRLGHGFVHAHHEVAQHGVAETERARQLCERGRDDSGSDDDDAPAVGESAS